MEDLFDILSEVTGITKYSGSEVITPKEIVADMVDLLPTEIFVPEARFLDPAVKSGRFLAEIYRRLMDSDLMVQAFPNEQARRQHILENQLYGFATSAVAATIVRKQLYDDPSIKGNIVYVDRYLVKMADKTTDFKKLVQGEFGENMKFDVVIGNPPYQESTGGNRNQGKPIYQHFIMQATKTSNRYVCMITPSRWFAGGMGVDELRAFMINGNKLKEIHDFVDGKQCFSGVSIAGGVSYFLYDKMYNGKCSVYNHLGKNITSKERYLNDNDVLIRDNVAAGIFEKIKHIEKRYVKEIVYSLNMFDIEAFDSGSCIPSGDYNIACHGSDGVSYVSKNDFNDKGSLLSKYKVVTTRGIGGDGVVLTKNTFVVKPNEVCTRTFLVIGAFDNEIYANNYLRYIKTKFSRFLLLQALTSIAISKEKFGLIPLQDFSHPWTDQMLYDKYGLTQEEIDYIEATIKPME